ncbi:hypothetical protein RRG08_022659 [Elysia crispata]|uniref:Uncharacterized protein n=1 Tax=Elysia crispata TaxID=231223 RepID=A0AAE0Z280_9GAST|nr:hypothetical protein RRG08_022659 [Elysia crispata]
MDRPLRSADNNNLSSYRLYLRCLRYDDYRRLSGVSGERAVWGSLTLTGVTLAREFPFGRGKGEVQFTPDKPLLLVRVS